MDTRSIDILELRNCTRRYHLVNGECIIGKAREVVNIQFGQNNSKAFVKVVSQNASEHYIALDMLCSID